MKEEFLKKLKANILKGGFPTELEVANIFNKRKWRVKHNTYFIDKDENKSREIDLISDFFQQYNSDDKYFEYTLSLIVEIKQEQSKPWVLFTTKSTKFEKVIYSIGPSREFTNYDWEKLRNSIRKNFPNLHERIGRSFTEGFSSGKDKIFNSLCNVTKALHFAKENNFNNKSNDKMLTFFEPMIVIKGELFEAFIDNNDELQIIEKNYIQFSFNYLSEHYKKKTIGHIINIVKFEYLNEFLEQREKVHKKIFKENT